MVKIVTVWSNKQNRKGKHILNEKWNTLYITITYYVNGVNTNLKHNENVERTFNHFSNQFNFWNKKLIVHRIIIH